MCPGITIMKVFKNYTIILLLLMSFGMVSTVISQTVTRKDKLYLLAENYNIRFQKNKQTAIEYASANNIPVRWENKHAVFELMYIDKNGMPQYFMSFNANAAATSSTNEVHTGGAAGLDLDGSGVSVVEWDADNVRTSHQEFDSRTTNMDGNSPHWHSTHVAGTIIASGVVANAKGMAPSASLKSYDWNYHHSEMAQEAAEGNLLSNHSYGFIRGWHGKYWYGDPSISNDEDYRCGFYDAYAKDWDEIAYNAPYYLIVKSAGNDRNDTGTGHDPDGPYDCIDQYGIAKNILTVGAVYDIPGGYTQPSDVVMSSFSSWGPADDGRIKPDIVANGTGLYSSASSADNGYASYSGTSMAAPTTTGSLALLVQHYENVEGSGEKMRAATLKALVLHTADEAGSNDGPDYSFGWGLLNTQSAAAKISEDTVTDVITEHVLYNSAPLGNSEGVFVREITTTGTSPIKVTIVWTDPPGTPLAPSLNPADTILVNDLDLKITEGANTYYPWKLDKDHPSDAATNISENDVDNVEMVYIPSPSDATTYTITVDHDGTLDSPQAFSMIISGDIDNAVGPTSDFYADNTTPGIYQQVNFTDASINLPTSWQWTFSPSTVQYLNGTSSTSQNPQVEFEETGNYEVSLYTNNTYGNNTETKTDYISVSASPQNYCAAASNAPYGYIVNVKAPNLNNASTLSASSPYYEDWTSDTTDMMLGHLHYIKIENGSDNEYYDVAIWIDWNRDGDFYDEGENTNCEENNFGEGRFAINVPADADTGVTRLRIRTKYSSDYACDPCRTTDYGEVEDYSIKIHTPFTWIGAEGGSWNTATNWSGGTVPDSTNGITVPLGDSIVINTGTNAVGFSLMLRDSAKINVKGILNIKN